MNVGSIIGGGFRLIREKPAAVAVWGLLYFIISVGMSLAMLSGLRASRSAILAPGASGAFPLANFSTLIAGFFVVWLLLMILYVVLLAAAQRAVLRPERDRFFYLRLGMDELRLIALAFIFVVLFYVGFLVAVLLTTLLIGLIAVAIGGGVAAALLGVVAVLALVALAIWLEVRFSLAFPLTLLRRKIVIGEAWRITRGRFWTLFGAFFVITLLLFAMWIAVAVMTNASYLAALMSAGSDPLAVQRAAQEQMAEQLGGISVMMVLRWVVGAIVGALTVAIFGGAVATAAKELIVDLDEIAETFA